MEIAISLDWWLRVNCNQLAFFIKRVQGVFIGGEVYIQRVRVPSPLQSVFKYTNKQTNNKQLTKSGDGLPNTKVMNNLLNIEQQFLSNENVKSMFKIKEAKKLKTALEANDKKKFLQSIEVGKILAEAEAIFVSEEGKRIFAEAGISWGKEEFFIKTFGWKKSYYCRAIKAAKFGDEKVQEFNAFVDSIRDVNKKVSRSLESFVKWAQGGDVVEGGEEGEDGGEDTNEAVKCVFTLSFRRADVDGGKNIAVRVKSDGTLEGSTKEEIQFAIQFLQSKLS